MPKRDGNSPRRRISNPCPEQSALKEFAATARYSASGHHKRNPADYGLERTNPRPTKSLCDGRRSLVKAEAEALLAKGFLTGLVSRTEPFGWPKFVWSVDADGVPYEAKTSETAPGQYHGRHFARVCA